MLIRDYLSIKLQFLRVSVRMPLEQLICLIRAKFVSREGATIELHCNDFFLYSSSSTSPDDQLFSPKTTFFEIFLRIWYPNKKSQPMQIIYREVFWQSEIEFIVFFTFLQLFSHIANASSSHFRLIKHQQRHFFQKTCCIYCLC